MTFISSSIHRLNHINEKLEEINGDSMQKYERYQLAFHLFFLKCVSNFRLATIRYQFIVCVHIWKATLPLCLFQKAMLDFHFP